MADGERWTAETRLDALRSLRPIDSGQKERDLLFVLADAVERHVLMPLVEGVTSRDARGVDDDPPGWRAAGLLTPQRTETVESVARTYHRWTWPSWSWDDDADKRESAYAFAHEALELDPTADGTPRL